MSLLHLLLLAVLTCSGLLVPSSAMPLNVTVSQQCTPLNVTWRAEPQSFPYTVWVVANHGFVQTFRINSDYQPGADHVTFQYVVPPPSAGFTSYTITVGDSRGDGNTTQALGIGTAAGSTSNCAAYTGSAAFTYAADPRNGTSMIQCGAVDFYNIGDRGTRPFTISFIPLGGTPVSVQVPNSATLNISNFKYLTYVPFQEGTQFQTVLGDASGPGSGGASEIFTVGPSTYSPFCLASSYSLPDKLNVALPTANNVATFGNLPGAIASLTPQTRSGSSPTGAIAGGAIGGAIALGVAIGCLIGYLVYRRRQKTKRDLARSEQVRFVDLDGEDDEDWAAAVAARPSRSTRRNGSGPLDDGASTRRSYAVSPFVYEPATDSSSDGRYGQSLEMTSPVSATNSSYGELLTAAGLARSGSHNDYPPRAGDVSVHSRHSSQDPFSSQNEVHHSGLSGAALHSAAAGAGTSSKAQAAAAQARRDNRVPRRIMQHTDGGSLPQPSSDTEDEEEAMDELPPEYGGWLQNSNPGGGDEHRTPSHSGARGTNQGSMAASATTSQTSSRRRGS
ncbi:hypothetical protein PHBOTO_003350 [Pseudozyma hubeiensis]|nr:hypothetical protein PHBOTO_003350 [Pseudozyma hubeiensis]